MDSIDFSSKRVNEIRLFIDELEKKYESRTGIVSREYINSLILYLANDGRRSVNDIGNKLERFLTKYDNEINRVKTLYDFDRSYGEYSFIAGVDEVGRGPLAGPIVAASVVLDLNYKCNSDLILYINDSKKVNEKLRKELSEIIKEKAVSYSIIALDNEQIDSKGIAWCNNEVFLRSCNSLKVKPSLVLSDGYPIKNIKYKNQFVIKGDTKSANIACASIIAKVYRDELMIKYANMYPQYNFEKNVGYGTEEHIKAIKKYGPCKIHRRCFLNNILSH